MIHQDIQVMANEFAVDTFDGFLISFFLLFLFLVVHQLVLLGHHGLKEQRMDGWREEERRQPHDFSHDRGVEESRSDAHGGRNDT